MCRHLAYLGPPIPLARLLFEPPHALVRQAFAPSDMRGGGTINADGFGVGWRPAGQDAALTYRRAHPMWTDAGLPALAAATTAGSVLAAVRSATSGMPVQESACAPFAADGWLFSLNGWITGWPESVAKLAESLPVTDLLTMPAPVDSALLWALLRRRLATGQPPADAVVGTVTEVAAAAPGSRLNLLLTGAHVIVATTLTHSLSIRQAAGSVLVSSEPLDDDPAWQPVPDGHLVVATPMAVDLSPLPPTGGST
jgi:gamma-glutamyl hercynylcysteine S-oxide hydrolase